MRKVKIAPKETFLILFVFRLDSLILEAETISRNVKQINNHSNFGFRIGWEYRVPLISKLESFEKRHKIIEKPAYFTFFHEFGLYPGYGILNNLYYKMGMSVEINFF